MSTTRAALLAELIADWRWKSTLRAPDGRLQLHYANRADELEAALAAHEDAPRQPEDAGATAALSDIDLATLVILAESAVKSSDEPTYPAMLAALRELQQRRSQPSPPRVLSRRRVLRLCPADAPAQETTK